MKQGRDQYRRVVVDDGDRRDGGDSGDGVRVRLWAGAVGPGGRGVRMSVGIWCLVLLGVVDLFCAFGSWKGSGAEGIGRGQTRFPEAGVRENGLWVRLFRVPPSWLWIGAWEAWCASGSGGDNGTSRRAYSECVVPDTPLGTGLQNGPIP